VVVFDSIGEGEAPAEPPSEFGSAGASPSRSECLTIDHAESCYGSGSNFVGVRNHKAVSSHRTP